VVVCVCCRKKKVKSQLSAAGKRKNRLSSGMSANDSADDSPQHRATTAADCPPGGMRVAFNFRKTKKVSCEGVNVSRR